MKKIQQSATEAGTWTNAEAAIYIGCTDQTLRQWTSRRKVPFVKVGRLTRFRKTDLDRWLEENAVPTPAGFVLSPEEQGRHLHHIEERTQGIEATIRELIRRLEVVEAGQVLEIGDTLQAAALMEGADR